MFVHEDLARDLGLRRPSLTSHQMNEHVKPRVEARLNFVSHSPAFSLHSFTSQVWVSEP